MQTWKWLYGLLLLLVVCSMVSAIVVGAGHADIEFRSFAHPAMWIGAAIYIVYCLANAAGWAWILRALQHPVPFHQAIPLWIRTESFRWLPGSVWNFGARSLEATRWDVPKSVAAGSISVELAFAVLTRLGLTVAGGFYLTHKISWSWSTPSLSVIGLTVVAFLMICVVGVILGQRLQGHEQWMRLRNTLETLSLSNLCCYGIWLGIYYSGLTVLYGIAFHYLVVAMIGPHDIPLSHFSHRERRGMVGRFLRRLCPQWFGRAGGCAGNGIGDLVVSRRVHHGCCRMAFGADDGGADFAVFRFVGFDPMVPFHGLEAESRNRASSGVTQE